MSLYYIIIKHHTVAEEMETVDTERVAVVSASHSGLQWVTLYSRCHAIPTEVFLCSNLSLLLPFG